jgi:DNA-binding transcriptional ArsR family regulator
MQVNKIALTKSLKVLRAIKHPLRQQIINKIESEGSINVTQLIASFDLVQSVVSQQLAILRNAELVIAKRDGKQVFYSINLERIELINNLISQF